MLSEFGAFYTKWSTFNLSCVVFSFHILPPSFCDSAICFFFVCSCLSGVFLPSLTTPFPIGRQLFFLDGVLHPTSPFPSTPPRYIKCFLSQNRLLFLASPCFFFFSLFLWRAVYIMFFACYPLVLPIHSTFNLF